MISVYWKNVKESGHKSNVMRKMLTLVLLLSFACSEETEFQCESCINMTISDALPIQFWRNGCQTYNEKESCGVHSFCWNQKFDCDDEIRLQLIDTEKDKHISLQLIDVDSNLIFETPFDETEYQEEAGLQFSNTDFPGNITGWNSFNGSDRSSGTQNGTWSYSAGDAKTGNSNYRTKYFATQNPDDVNGWPAGDYQITARVIGFSENGPFTAKVFGMPSSSSQTEISSSVTGTISTDGITEQTITISFSLDQYWEYLAFTFDSVLDVGDVSVTIVEISITQVLVYSRTVYNLSFIPSELSPEICDQKVQFVIVDDNTSPAEIAKSDYVEFSSNLTCTQLLKYRNQRNFAGIDYVNLVTNTSPAQDEYFYIRVPAVFFHERQQGESEALELSNSKYISINGVLRQQKLLELDYMPYYMHKKIQLILMHQYLEDVETSTRWTKQENYEVPEGNKRYPLKMAKVWLTERDFVARNVV